MMKCFARRWYVIDGGIVVNVHGLERFVLFEGRHEGIQMKTEGGAINVEVRKVDLRGRHSLSPFVGIGSASPVPRVPFFTSRDWDAPFLCDFFPSNNVGLC